MKNNILRKLIALVCLLFSLNASAYVHYTTYNGQHIYYYWEDRQYPNRATVPVTTAPSSYAGVLEIPSEFYHYRSGNSYYIKGMFTTIGENTFSGCTQLTAVTIPNTVTSIGDSAFYNCAKLESIIIPTFVVRINRSAFQNCSALKSAIIGSSVTSLDDYAFSGCTSLTSVSFPDSVTNIGNNTFEDCSGLTSLSIPNSIINIGKSAFRSCSGLTSIIVETENIKYNSRYNCNAIIETETNTLIQGCQNTIIPNTVIRIGEYAFYNCIGLTSVTIPNSVTSIGEYAFYNCIGLTSVTISNSVTSISRGTFTGCDSLTAIYCKQLIHLLTTVPFLTMFYNMLHYMYQQAVRAHTNQLHLGVTFRI